MKQSKTLSLLAAMMIFGISLSSEAARNPSRVRRDDPGLASIKDPSCHMRANVGLNDCTDRSCGAAPKKAAVKSTGTDGRKKSGK